MIKKLKFIPICCLLILIASTVSADSMLPPLPGDKGPEVTSSDSKKEITTWQKIKSFFGMESTKESNSLEESQTNDQKNENDTQNSLSKEIEGEDNNSDKLMSPEDFIEKIDEKLLDSEIQGTQDLEDQNIILPINNSTEQRQTKLDPLGEEFEIPSLDDELLSVDEIDLDGSDNDIRNEGSEIPTLNQGADLEKEKANLKIQDNTEQLTSAEKDVVSKPRENNDAEIDKVQDAVIENKKEEIVLTVPDYDAKDPEELGTKSDRHSTSSAPSLENKVRNQQNLNQDKIKQDKDNRELQKFISNEIQVLLLPNDDVVLGEVTSKARLTQMDFTDYIRVFWQKYNKLVRREQTRAIKDFIDSYDETFNQSD